MNRGRAKPSAGPPGLPRRGGIPTGNPLSGRTGRRGATGRGEGLALPPAPQLSRLGRFPTDTCPCQAAAGRGAWGVRAVPAGPVARCGCSYRSDTYCCQAAAAEGEKLVGGGLGPPSDFPVAAARPLSNGYLPLSATAARGGLGVRFVPARPAARGRRRRRSDASPCHVAKGEGRSWSRREPVPPRPPSLSQRGRFQTDVCPCQSTDAGTGPTPKDSMSPAISRLPSAISRLPSAICHQPPATTPPPPPPRLPRSSPSPRGRASGCRRRWSPRSRA